MHAVSRSFATLAAVAALGLPAIVVAQDDAFDRTPVKCLPVSNIDRTDVLDDNTIVFFMRGRKIYRNYLPKRCPGLERNDRFSYQTTSNRLCDIDTVTVLEQWGGRLSSGFTCPLGEFHPITREEFDELKAIQEDGGQRNDAISAEPVELPADAADPAAGAPPDEE
jgi:hypothetical protein